MKKIVNNHFYQRKNFYINECEHVEDTKYIRKIEKKTVVVNGHHNRRQWFFVKMNVYL